MVQLVLAGQPDQRVIQDLREMQVTQVLMVQLVQED